MVGTQDWQPFGTVCLGSRGEVFQARITEAMVATRFKALDWPAATLEVQPPDGETLVNLDTIFYTTTSGPTVQRLRLLGHRVEVRATPRHYTWHWATPQDGDRGRANAADLAAATTTGPGLPYPDQTVTHRYAVVAAAVHPRVDVTYGGDYRVDDGEWLPIDATLTVRGPSETLSILEARPTLVR